MHLEVIQKRLQRPVRWFTSRDSSRLNNLGISLMGIGATVAVTTGAVKFTNQLVPWWSVIVGLAVFAAGLALTGYTMGATGSPAIETSSDEGDSSETQRPIIDSKIEIDRCQTKGPELRDGDAIFSTRSRPQMRSASILPTSTGESNRDAGREIDTSEVLPLPVAADSYVQIAAIIEQFKSLEELPDPPRRVTGSTVFRWNVEMATWIRDTEAVLEAAYRIAKTREREGFPSVELAQNAADARAGLQKLRNLIRQHSELTDWRLDPAIPQGIRENVASVVVLAVNS